MQLRNYFRVYVTTSMFPVNKQANELVVLHVIMAHSQETRAEGGAQ